MGVGKGGLATLEFEIWHFPITFLPNKCRFLSFEWVKQSYFATFGLPWKNIFGYVWKNPLCPPLEKILPTPMLDGDFYWTEKILQKKKHVIR